MDRIVIIGLGLIGGSLGMALKAAKLHDVEIIGVDNSWDVVNMAKRKGAVDAIERNPLEAVASAQVVIVATPILTFPDVFRGIAPHLPEGCVVTDTGSTKAQVLEWARELLPPTVSFVGGHPMAGKENSGIQNASPTLFQKTLYCVVPTPEASKTSMDLIVGLATTVGATQYFVDAAEHDILVGGISHLPLLVSAALVSTTTRSPSWDEMSKLASSGFLDVSRLASTDIELSRGIGQTNQAGLLRWLDGYMEVLADYRRALVEDMGGFIEELSQARDSRDKWLLGQLQTGEGKSMVEIPSAAEQMGEIFVGGRLTQLMRQQEERLREREKGPNDRA